MSKRSVLSLNAYSLWVYCAVKLERFNFIIKTMLMTGSFVFVN